MPPVMSVVDTGKWLVAHLAEMERRESAWLEILAAFDEAQGWAVDGQLSCAEWLMWKGRMGRATAYEKLLVAHQLRRRPVLREAFAGGRLSYSALRVIVRMEDPDPEVDEAMVALAEAGTVRDVERVAAAYRRHSDQHRSPGEATSRRAIRVKPNADGTSSIEVTLSDLEVEEVMACLQAFLDSQTPEPDEVGAGEEAGAAAAGAEAAAAGAEGGVEPAGRGEPGGTAAQSARADWADEESARAGGVAPLEQGSWAHRAADAFMEMVRTGLAHVRDGAAAGDDRYMVHVISTLEGMVTLDGAVVDDATARRIACDSARVEHVLGPEFEPVAVGRRTREWTTAQRRAARVRDGGRCRFPGCHRRVVDLHHCVWWAAGGPTDISNGILCCPRHHTMLHSGFATSGDANRELSFHRPDGSILGRTGPRRPAQRVVAVGG